VCVRACALTLVSHLTGIDHDNIFRTLVFPLIGIDHDKIFIFGRSLGGAVAMDVAFNNQARMQSCLMLCDAVSILCDAILVFCECYYGAVRMLSPCTLAGVVIIDVVYNNNAMTHLH
jgi:hypothetical protein